jgi:MFS family permease
MMLMDELFLDEMGFYDPSYYVSNRFITLFFAGEILGAMLSYLFSDTFGRKATLIYFSAICIFAIIWSILTTSGADFLTSRFIMGLSLGVLLSTAPVYTSEIAMTANRGFSIGMLGLTTLTGSILAGPFHYFIRHYGLGCRVSMVLPVAVLALEITVLSFLPESPRWLLALHTPAECLESMRLLRRTNDISKEFNDIYLALSSDAVIGDGWIDILSSQTIRYRLFLCCVLQLSQQLVGIGIITILGTDFLEILETQIVLWGLGVAYLSALLGTLLGLLKVDQWGRRSLLLVGCAIMSISWIGAAACVYSGELLKILMTEEYENAYIYVYSYQTFVCIY